MDYTSHTEVGCFPFKSALSFLQFGPTRPLDTLYPKYLMLATNNFNWFMFIINPSSTKCPKTLKSLLAAFLLTICAHNLVIDIYYTRVFSLIYFAQNSMLRIHWRLTQTHRKPIQHILPSLSTDCVEMLRRITNRDIEK